MTLTITWLSHAGFIFDDGTTRLVVDPFLTGNPTATVDPATIDCSHIALTHAHDDHFGDTMDIARRTGATVHAPFELAEHVQSLGHEHVSPANPGGTIATDFGSIAFTHAVHSSSLGGAAMGAACGLVIRMGGQTVYHAGDTDLFGDMKLIGEIHRPDIAILPIGDRFTMGPKLASRAADLIGAPHVIPCHYDTWPPIAQDPADLTPSTATVHVMTPGRPATIGG